MCTACNYAAYKTKRSAAAAAAAGMAFFVIDAIDRHIYSLYVHKDMKIATDLHI